MDTQIWEAIQELKVGSAAKFQAAYNEVRRSSGRVDDHDPFNTNYRGNTGGQYNFFAEKRAADVAWKSAMELKQAVAELPCPFEVGEYLALFESKFSSRFSVVQVSGLDDWFEKQLVEVYTHRDCTGSDEPVFEQLTLKSKIEPYDPEKHKEEPRKPSGLPWLK